MPLTNSLLCAQEDILDANTGEVLIPKDAHMMYVRAVETRTHTFGHRVVIASTLRHVLLDPGSEFVDADGKGTLYIVRPRFDGVPLIARQIREGVTQT